MKFGLFKKYGALNSVPVFESFEQSLKKFDFKYEDNCFDADVAVIWSVLWNGRMKDNKIVWDYFRSKNKKVIVLEVGGIQRGHTWKVGLNGVNNSAILGPKNQSSERAKKLNLNLKDWRKQGEFILICAQHEKSDQWKNMPKTRDWFLDKYTQIRKYTDRPIIFRPHPRFPLHYIDKNLKNVYVSTPKKIAGSYDNFDLTFDRVWITINENSNPGPQSIIQGIPAITGKHSLAYSVSEKHIKNIEDPLMPDRTQWINDYAHTEYTLDEIKQGVPLEFLTNYL